MTMDMQMDNSDNTLSTGLKSITLEDRSDSLAQYTFKGLPHHTLLRKFSRMNSEMEVDEPKYDAPLLGVAGAPAVRINVCDICRSECIKNK